jgi:hypothetical protein
LRRRLVGDTARAATSDEEKDLRGEARALKEEVADLTLENRLLKKSMIGMGRRSMKYLASDLERQVAAFVRTTTMRDTTRASTISLRQTSTSGRAETIPLKLSRIGLIALPG